MANVPDGNPATNQRQPYQTEFIWIDGSPEGIEFGPAGSVRTDAESGTLWRKTTTADLATGWEPLIGSMIGFGVPIAPAADGAQYIDRTTRKEYFYDALMSQWLEPAGGGGGTGGANLIGSGDPTGPAADGSRYINRLNANDWYYDATGQGVWVQLRA